MTATALPASRTSAPKANLDAGTLLLYGAIVLIWGTSWIALKAQLGVVAPEVSILWRFVIALAVMLAWAAWRGESMVFAAADHLRFAGTGLFLFSGNFTLFYYGGASVPSGLLAVVFSLASIFNLLLAAVLLRQRPELRLALGGLLGVGGVALLFWPQIAGAPLEGGALEGLGLCVAGTLFFCLGNMVSGSIQRRGVPLVAATTWGMVYGCGFLLALALLRGQVFAVEWSGRYLLSLAYLGVVCSALAFMTYLTLLRRIGSSRAGYATVLFPVVALLVSTAVEGYAWTGAAAAGAMLALAGNALVLSGPRRS